MTTQNVHLLHPKYRPDIDGLRAIAVLAVVMFHAFPNVIRGGFIGVDIFFVISGFLISTIIFENLQKGTFSFSNFYARRIKRIFPALILIFVTCLILGWFILIPEEINQLARHIVAGTGFVSNIVMWHEVGYFDNIAETKPLLHLWSLGIEEQFYIIWPLLIWLVWKRNLNLLSLIIIFTFISFSLNIKNIEQDPMGTFYLPLTRAWELLCGSILAWHLIKKSKNVPIFKETLKNLTFYDEQKLSHIYSIVGILLLVYGLWRINKNLTYPSYWAIIPVLGSILIILAGQKAWFNRKILSNKVLVWFGLISFPLYLWHWPLLSFGYIIYFDTPPQKFRILAIIISVILAWLTVKFIEKPLRLGNYKSTLKVIILSSSMVFVSIISFFISRADFSDTHTFENRIVKRKGEHAIGSSLIWYQGKSNWLFLGNANNNTIAKLKLAVKPKITEIDNVKDIFSKISQTAFKNNISIALIIGPDKSTIYPEYLPEGLKPSPIRYVNFFIEKLRQIPNLIVYDPTYDLQKIKKIEGLLYWKTDTHWNDKGAFLAYSEFSKLLDLPIPKVQFIQNQITHSGDLIEISKLENFPLDTEDNWQSIWSEKSILKEIDIPNEQKTSFGSATIVTNSKPLSNKYVWVVGDSFSRALRPYFNATFKEIHYIGHWDQKLKLLPDYISQAERKPDLIVIVRVERSF